MKSSFFNLALTKRWLLLFFLSSSVMLACSKSDPKPDPTPTPADKTALATAIQTAQDLIDNTEEGTKPGQYEEGSKATLQTALNASKDVNNDKDATQAQVNNTVAQLNAAIEAYKGHFIEEIAVEDLVAFWKLDGDADDASGNGHDGTIMPGHEFFGGGILAPAQNRFGEDGMAYHFDKGANIEVPYDANLNPQEITISLWAKQDAAAETREINSDSRYMVSLNHWNGYKFQTQGGSLPFFTVKAVENGTDTTIYDRDDAGTAIESGQWYHLVVTYKAGSMIFYINGDQVTEWDNVPGTPIKLEGEDITNLTIGSDLPNDVYTNEEGDNFVEWGGFWTGDLDDIMIYKKALSGPQIQSIYVNQKTQ